MSANRRQLENPKIGLVITTINEPNEAMMAFAKGCRNQHWQFYVVGDEKGPARFDCDGAAFYSLSAQLSEDLSYARACPTSHYARKNIGYLLAMRDGAQVIVETDDDNIPEASFWSHRSREQEALVCDTKGWMNVYKYFSDSLIWPRGFPLDCVALPHVLVEKLRREHCDSPIQQALANDNPDVDAIYRLLLPLPQRFRDVGVFALDRGVWCPFNSQNTTWWDDSFPLLYLPAYCSFRMTDIWRSFVAQRIAWQYGWRISFSDATVFQERNAHNLMRDFEDEVPGYLHNKKICSLLEKLDLSDRLDAIGDNLLKCYEALVGAKYFESSELDLLASWLADLDSLQQRKN